MVIRERHSRSNKLVQRESMKRKILMYIDHRYSGGAQRVLVNLANHFSSRDIEVIFVVDTDDERKIRNSYPEAIRYPLNFEIKIFSLEDIDENRWICSNLRRIFGLRNIVKNEFPDIVLSFLGRVNIRMLLATTGLKVKKCVSVRSDPRREYGSSLIKKALTNVLFLLSDKYVFQTEDACLWFLKSVQKKSEIIVNPVEDQFFSTVYTGESNDIISVGRLDSAKNHEMLIEAFSIVVKDCRDTRLVIYGTGPLKKRLQKRINELNLQGKVILYGTISNVWEVLKSAKLFVLASDYEGMPNALMEAMAVGVPCISTDCPVGGPKMLFGEELSRYLVPCGNVGSMAECIRELIKNKDIRDIARLFERRAESFRAEQIYMKWEKYLFN